MYMFGSQLGFEEELVQKRHRVVQFLLTVYNTTWLPAPVASEAPANDLRLYRTLLGYRRLDFEVAEAAIQVPKRHLWYLRPEVLVFSLFGEQVSPGREGRDEQTTSGDPTSLRRTLQPECCGLG